MEAGIWLRKSCMIEHGPWNIQAYLIIATAVSPACHKKRQTLSPWDSTIPQYSARYLETEWIYLETSLKKGKTFYSLWNGCLFCLCIFILAWNTSSNITICIHKYVFTFTVFHTILLLTRERLLNNEVWNLARSHGIHSWISHLTILK